MQTRLSRTLIGVCFNSRAKIFKKREEVQRYNYYKVAANLQLLEHGVEKKGEDVKSYTREKDQKF